MKIRFLTIAVALVSLFAVQPAFAKHSTKTPKTAASKKHHKKHVKKTGTASLAAPAVNAAAEIS
jgi:hypothetical protein